MISCGDMQRRCASMQTKEHVTVYKEPHEVCAQRRPLTTGLDKILLLHKKCYQVEHI